MLTPGGFAMTRTISIVSLLTMLALVPLTAEAHCDALDGPVATAALSALDSGNVHVVLPYVAADGEREVVAAFEQARDVRTKGPAAKALADRYFIETAIRVHRAGEKAPYTGVKPAGTDFGPAIPAAEKALATGKPDEVLALLSREASHGVTHRLEEAAALHKVSRAPTSAAEVAAARNRVQAELHFIEYVESVYRAAAPAAHGAPHGAGHRE
jgi:uncharacterized protein DUF6448